jgi:hypothetical protein
MKHIFLIAFVIFHFCSLAQIQYDTFKLITTPIITLDTDTITIEYKQGDVFTKYYIAKESRTDSIVLDSLHKLYVTEDEEIERLYNARKQAHLETGSWLENIRKIILAIEIYLFP